MEINQITAIEEFIANLREIFFTSLDTKTGWGKEVLKNQFNLDVSSAVIKTIKECKDE